MKHSKYDEFYNFMSGNNKTNINKKSGNKSISTPIENFDEKLKFWCDLIKEKYEDPTFYLLRHEHNKLFTAFIGKENNLFSKSKIFTYKGNKFECEEFQLIPIYRQFENTNRIVVFHDFNRSKQNGEITILVKAIAFT